MSEISSSYTLNTRLYMCSCDILILSMIQTYEQADQYSRADDQGLLFSGARRSRREWVQLLQRAAPLFPNKDSCLSCSAELHTEAPAQCWQSAVETRRSSVPAERAESLCEGLKSWRRGAADGPRPSGFGLRGNGAESRTRRGNVRASVDVSHREMGRLWSRGGWTKAGISFIHATHSSL